MNNKPHGFTHYIFGASTGFSSATFIINWLNGGRNSNRKQTKQQEVNYYKSKTPY
jgi:hypothetical protein